MTNSCIRILLALILLLSVKAVVVSTGFQNFMIRGTLKMMMGKSPKSAWLSTTSLVAGVSYIYTVNYGKTFSNVPQIVVGIAGLEMFNATGKFYLYHGDQSVGTSSYKHYSQLSTSIQVADALINFLAIDTSSMPFFRTGFYTRNTTTLSNGSIGVRLSSTTQSTLISVAFNTSNFNAINVFLAGWEISQSPSSVDKLGTYNIVVNSSIVTNTSINFKYNTLGKTQVIMVDLYFLFIDKTVVEKGGFYRLDYGSISGSNNIQTAEPIFTAGSPLFFFSGITQFWFQNYTSCMFNMSSSVAPFSIQSTYGYTNLGFNWFSLTKVPCHYSCAFCSGSITSCTACVTSRVMMSGTCVCPAGKIDIGVPTCSSCHYSCGSCSINTTNCISCPTGSGRTLVSNTCPCLPGYFEQSVRNCTKCSTSCLTCSSATVCLTCNSTMGRVLVGTSCLCNSQYAEVSGVCQICSSILLGCLQCSGPTTCTVCQIGFTLAGGTCSCSTGYFLNSSTQCQLCSSVMIGCASCTNSVTCTSCRSADFFALSGSTCACMSGFTFNNSTNTCWGCAQLPNCYSCPSSQTVCQACHSPQSQLSGTSCICATGYYPDPSSQICLACPYNCQTCTSAIACLTCPSTRNSSSSSCACNIGTYDVGTATCSNCNSTCLTCQGTSDNCTACGSAQSRQLSGTTCVCLIGYFEDVYGTCVACDYSCVTCDISPTNCLTCPSTRTSNGTSCLCNNGTYDIGASTCQVCDYTCVTCMNAATFCIECEPTRTLVNSSCLCLDGYFDQGVSTCSPCPSPCLTCSSSLVCTSCDTAALMMLVSGACVCNNESALVGSTCQLCSSLITNCQSCSGPAACSACMADSVSDGIGGCVCAPGFYADSKGTCIGCDQIIQGCLMCSSSAICTQCDISLNFELNASAGCSCKAGTTYFSVAKACGSCLSNQYYDGVSCANCHPSCQTCNAGLINDCLTCISPLTKISGSCQCQPGTFFDQSNSCSACDPQCQNCSGSATNCTSCAAPLTLKSDNTCSCPTQNYLATSPSLSCLSCDPSCQECSGPNKDQCTSCNAPSTLLNGACVCSPYYYLDPSTSSCAACAQTCYSCNGSANNNCLSCNKADRRVLDNSACVCNYYSTETGAQSCQFNGCPTGTTEVDMNCQEICGDGLLFQLECDDGNNFSGDGCSSTCTIEPDFNCTGGSPTSATICSYTKSLSIILVSTQKQMMSNTVKFNIKIEPALPSLNNLNFSSVFSCNLTGATLTYAYDNAGNLVVSASYNSTIQDQNITLQFTPPAGDPRFESTPRSQMSFVIDPDNNLAAVYYSNDVYNSVDMFDKLAQVVMYSSLAVFFVGLVAGKFIGVEMMGVIQVSYIGLMIINYVNPILAPLTKIAFVNGFNSMFSSPSVGSSIPNRITSLSYQGELAYNLNYTTALLLLPFIVSLILFIASKISKQNSQKLQRYCMISLCEYGMAGSMFILYQLTVSVVLFAIYNPGASSSLFYVSVGESLLCFTIIIAVAVLFHYKQEYFGEFKEEFKKDRFSQSYYWILMAGRVILAVMLVGANGIDVVGFVSMIVPLAGIVLLAIKMPYLRNYNNYRMLANESIMLLVLGIYGYYRMFTHSTQDPTTISSVMPYVLIGLLLVCILMNAAIMAKYGYDRCTAGKRAKEQKIAIEKAEQDQENQFIQETKLRLKAFSDTVKAFGKNKSTRHATQQKLFSPEKAIVNQQSDPNDSIVMADVKQQLRKQLLTEKKVSFEVKAYAEEEVKEIEDNFDAI